MLATETSGEHVWLPAGFLPFLGVDFATVSQFGASFDSNRFLIANMTIWSTSGSRRASSLFWGSTLPQFAFRSLPPVKIIGPAGSWGSRTHLQRFAF